MSVSRRRTPRCAKKSEVTSVEEGHAVERVSDETAGILKQLKDETSADLTVLEK